MKNAWIYLALLCEALFFFSCSDDDLLPKGIPLTGEEISFGVKAVVDTRQYGMKTITDEKTKESRTVYGEIEGDTGNQSVQIHWVSGDQLTIASEQSVGAKVASYRIPHVNKTQPSLTDTLERITPVKGLQWGTTPHNFYGVYPSTETLDVLSLKMNPSSEKLTGFMPSTYNAEPKVEAIAGGTQHLYTVVPNMDYAIMTAKATGITPSDQVHLTFFPIVTAIEFDITLQGYLENTEKIELLSLTLKSETQSIVGNFEYDFSKEKVKNLCTLNDGTNTVNLNFKTPVPMKANDKLSATFFFIPSDDEGVEAAIKSGDLTLSFAYQDQTGGIFFKKATLNVDFHARRKYFFRDMQMPPLNPLTSSNWFEQLDDDIYISQLSFPGASHVVSSQYTGANKSYYQEQVYPFKTLWEKGVRGFELKSSYRETKSDKVDQSPSIEAIGITGTSSGWDKNNYVTAFEFASTPFVCSGTELLGAGKFALGGAFANGYETIEANPLETLVLLFTYQSYAGDGNGQFRPDLYLQGLQNFLTEFCNEKNIDKDKTFVQLGTESTVGDLRGKIAIIIRLYDNHNVINTSAIDRNLLVPNDDWKQYITVIDNWGTCIDNWDVRYGDQYAREGAFTTHANERIEDLMWWGIRASATDEYAQYDDATGELGEHEESNNFPTSNYDNYKFHVNNGYSTDKPGNTNCAWVQCWERVVPKTQRYYTGAHDIWNTWRVEAYLWFQWRESLSEKVGAMKHVADQAMSSRGVSAHTLFVNVLTGYYPVQYGQLPGSCNPYMQPDIVYSWDSWGPRELRWPEQITGGDYASCCGTLNYFLYDYLTNKPADQLGPLGLVMMGYIAASEQDFQGINNYEISVKVTNDATKERVEVAEAVKASAELPKLILANNYHFPLIKKVAGQNQTSTDNSQSFEDQNDIISFK